MSDSDAICLTLQGDPCGCTLWQEWVAPELRDVLEAAMLAVGKAYQDCVKDQAGSAPEGRYLLPPRDCRASSCWRKSPLRVHDTGHIRDYRRTIANHPPGTVEVNLPPGVRAFMRARVPELVCWDEAMDGIWPTGHHDGT